MAMGLLAAACGGGGGGGGSKGETGSAPTDEGTPEAGGQVIYALESETNAGWCLPESQLAISGIQVARSIYDTLVQPDENDEMVPMLAESVEPNDTYDEWTLKIRQGVKFHDGSALTAEVVKNNLDAYRGQYEGRKPLLFVFVLDNIDTVEATDASTVVITTKTPWPALPSALYNNGRLGMMGQAQLDNAENCNKDLVGTGPFKLKDWKVNDKFVAEKNPDYWETDADGNALPYLDEIEYRPVSDSGSRIEGLQTGQFDIIHTSGGEAAQQLTPVADSGQINMISNSDFAEVGYAMTNEAKAPFDNLDARLAVAYGMDRDELIALRTGGLQEVASGPFAPGTMGYLEDTGFPDHDLEKAKEHAAAYKKATGEDLAFTLTYVAFPGTKTDAELIQSQLADAADTHDHPPGWRQRRALDCGAQPAQPRRHRVARMGAMGGVLGGTAVPRAVRQVGSGHDRAPSRAPQSAHAHRAGGRVDLRRRAVRRGHASRASLRRRLRALRRWARRGRAVRGDDGRSPLVERRARGDAPDPGGAAGRAAARPAHRAACRAR
jgi:peptide/nickel transport system substrate-binding protein